MDVEAKPGSKRSIGEVDFFLPVWQDGKGLLFGNARVRIADHDNREGNLGLGYRRMLEGGWNLGGYGYYDRRRSTTGNYFNQVTLGAEALGRDWDFRGNVYLPQGDRVRDLGTSTAGGGAPTAAIVGTTVQVTTPGSTTFTTQERALKGYDLEAGWRVPVWAAEADKQLRLYAGGYHFSDGGVRVAGPRVRAELTMAELPSLWKGAQLILGAEYQDDNARGGQGFISARLRIPLGSEKSSGYRMNWQERRMTAPVVRDVDVVTQSRSVVTASTPATVETATQTAGGQAITVLDSGTTTGAALPGAVAAAGNDSVVILSGTFNTVATVTVQGGQTLVGQGSMTVTTPSGRSASLTTSAATLSSSSGTAVNVSANGTLSGLTISGTGLDGVRISGANATISGNTIAVNAAGGPTGILLNAGGATIVGNTVSATSTTGGQADALFLQANSNLLIQGNTLSAASAGIANVVSMNSATILPGSTGNIRITGGCGVSASPTGFIGFVDGTTCP